MHALQTDDRHAAIDAAIAELRLSVSAQFVPFSRSRNAKEKSPSLNWWVTIKRGERTLLETDYSAGCGHCPGYRQPETGESRAAVARECETGYPSRYMANIDAHIRFGNAPILPDTRDVIYSLVMDAGVLDARDFEDWAASYGYDPDSRKAEATYRACLEIALQLRNGIGESGLARLQEAFQDY